MVGQNDTWREIDQFLRSRGIRIGPPTTGQTTGGKHAPTSYHYEGTARDYGLYDSDAPAVARALQPVAAQPNSPIAELFFAPLNIWYKHGHRVPGSSIGGHQDHCHVALEIGRHLSNGSAPPVHHHAGSPGHPANRPTISWGSSGDAVKLLQKKLNARGHHLVEDGIFGPMTNAAVMAFQRSHGLVVDGIVGPRTWAALG